MLAKGTSPIVVLPVVLFIICILAYLFMVGEWPIIVLAILFFVLSVTGLAFFRDPSRTIGPGIVSAADGVVSFVRRSKGRLTVSVFMNVHNVHVNRAPLEGKVKRVKHVPGGHAPAYKEISKDNEHFVTEMETELGPVTVIQIAGTVARRIVPYIDKGDRLAKGQRIGIIRLGSRVDVILPSDKVHPKVKEGQKVLSGETTIAVPKKGKKATGGR